MKHFVAISLMFLYATGYIVAQDKRVLLHSDQDLYQVISSLQTEMVALNSSLRAEVAAQKASLMAERNLSSSVLNELAAMNSSLNAKVQNLTSSLQTETTLTSNLRTEVATLKSLLETETSSRQAEVGTLHSQIMKLETNLLNAQQAIGSVYVRWGRTSCPANGTEMIYKGRMAGSKYDESGGGANHQCLPDDPTWGKHVDGLSGYGTIYGTEIGEPDDVANILFGKPVQDQDVPCAVCRTSRPSNVMISGRASCYPGWTMEYLGYLISNHPSISKSNADYVCLDTGLEFASHGAADDNEHIVKIVEVVCGQKGSLPCPPYVNGMELPCVVCSK